MKIGIVGQHLHHVEVNIALLHFQVSAVEPLDVQPVFGIVVGSDPFISLLKRGACSDFLHKALNISSNCPIIITPAAGKFIHACVPSVEGFCFDHVKRC